MKERSSQIKRTYLVLLTLNTLSASFIWGINTLFLLDAGLNNTEAFSANAFFTAGMLLFEIPTGIVADTWGRKLSYLLGALTLAITTALYLWLWYLHASFWPWAIVSIFLGLGFTFFSGAFEAWLVDAFTAMNYKEGLETVFAHAQIVEGAAMLVGSVAGGVVAQFSNLGIPYLFRIATFIVTFVLASFLMRDIGFTPSRTKEVIKGAKEVWKNSLKYGLKKPSVRWIMLAVPFTNGVMIYAFYAMQPYLLKLYGDAKAYSIAGLAAAIISASQIVGGLLAPYIKVLFTYRTKAMCLITLLGAIILALIGIASTFTLVILLLIAFGLLFAAITPIRQIYLNGLIPSEQRATILSFDSLMGSGGAVFIQPILGKTADVWNYATSYVVGAAFQLLSLPFFLLAHRENPPTDKLAP